jgi:hypothetical protein
VNCNSYILGHHSITPSVGGSEMTGSTGSSSGNGTKQTVVVVELPTGREFVWPPSVASMVSWQIGERVTYRGERWKVVSRANGSDVLTLELAPDESDLLAAGASASDV